MKTTPFTSLYFWCWIHFSLSGEMNPTGHSRAFSSENFHTFTRQYLAQHTIFHGFSVVRLILGNKRWKIPIKMLLILPPNRSETKIWCDVHNLDPKEKHNMASWGKAVKARTELSIQKSGWWKLLCCQCISVEAGGRKTTPLEKSIIHVSCNHSVFGCLKMPHIMKLLISITSKVEHISFFFYLDKKMFKDFLWKNNVNTRDENKKSMRFNCVSRNFELRLMVTREWIMLRIEMFAIELVCVCVPYREEITKSRRRKTPPLYAFFPSLIYVKKTILTCALDNSFWMSVTFPPSEPSIGTNPWKIHRTLIVLTSLSSVQCAPYRYEGVDAT